MLYIDNLKVSHKKKLVVDLIVSILQPTFGDVAVTYGMKHTYFRMEFYMTVDNEVNLFIKHYLKEIIKNVLGETKDIKIPAILYLSEVRDNAVKLNKQIGELSH